MDSALETLDILCNSNGREVNRWNEPRSSPSMSTAITSYSSDFEKSNLSRGAREDPLQNHKKRVSNDSDNISGGLFENVAIGSGDDNTPSLQSREPANVSSFVCCTTDGCIDDGISNNKGEVCAEGLPVPSSRLAVEADYIPFDYEAEMEDCCHYVFSAGPYCPITSGAASALPAPNSDRSPTSHLLAEPLSAASPHVAKGEAESLDDFIPIDYDGYIEEYDEMCAGGQIVARPSDGGCTYFTGEDDDGVDGDDNDLGVDTNVSGEGANGCDSVDSFSMYCVPISPSYCSPPVGHSPMSNFPESCHVNSASKAAPWATLASRLQKEEEVAPFSPAWLHRQQLLRDIDVKKQTKRRVQQMQEEQNYFAHSCESAGFSLKCLINEACRQDLCRLRALPASFFAKDENLLRLLNTDTSSMPVALHEVVLSSTLLTPGMYSEVSVEQKKKTFIDEVRQQWRRLATRLTEELEDPHASYRRLVSEVNVLSLFTHNVPLAMTCEKTALAQEQECLQGRTQYVSLSAARTFEVSGSSMIREMNDSTVDELRRRRIERQEALIGQLRSQNSLFVLPSLRAEEYEAPVPIPTPVEEEHCAAAEPIPCAPLMTTDSAICSPNTRGPAELPSISKPDMSMSANLACSASFSRKTFSMSSRFGNDNTSGSSASDDGGLGGSWDELSSLRLDGKDTLEEEEGTVCANRTTTVLSAAIGSNCFEEREDEEGFVELFSPSNGPNNEGTPAECDSGDDVVVVSREDAVGPANGSVVSTTLVELQALSARLKARVTGDRGSAKSSSSGNRRHPVRCVPQQLSGFFVSSFGATGGGISLSTCNSPSKFFCLPAAVAAAAAAAASLTAACDSPLSPSSFHNTPTTVHLTKLADCTKTPVPVAITRSASCNAVLSPLSGSGGVSDDEEEQQPHQASQLNDGQVHDSEGGKPYVSAALGVDENEEQSLSSHPIPLFFSARDKSLSSDSNYPSCSSSDTSPYLSHQRLASSSYGESLTSYSASSSYTSLPSPTPFPSLQSALAGILPPPIVALRDCRNEEEA